ncbi:MAG: NACHT and WD repeat domain-containing protein [Gaiellaceae bacterium]
MSTVGVTPVSPFKGLAAFEDSELDALFFFGREREKEVLVANLLASRLTILYGESGVGKSSLLAAAVVRDLRLTAPEAAVFLLGTWSEPISQDVLGEVRAAPEAYLILDQFEEYFLYQSDAGEPGTLLGELPNLLHEARINVLVSLREDSLARLDALKARIPGVFGNQVRLEHLDRSEARAAILRPIERWNELTGESMQVDPSLVDGVIEEVAVEGRSRDRSRIEAPYLQLVLERIWESERAEGSTVLRLETLRRLGGAATIVREHLDLALAALGPLEQDVAASMFEHLVTPSGTKIALRAPDLAHYADVPEDTLRRVLTALTQDRIVHSVDGSDRYEIFHDVLGEPIRAWRQERRLEQERRAARRRQRRLAVVAAAALAALAIVAGLAIWAFSERGSARSQARQAHAQALDATALQQLAIDPNRGVRLALAAVRLEPGRVGETVLRQALVADRLRLIKYTSAAVRAVATSPRGDLIGVALVDGRVLLLDAHNRRLIRTIDAGAPAAHLTFAADGRRIVTVSALNIAKEWTVSTGAPVPLHARRAGARTPSGAMLLIPLHGRLASVIYHVRGLVADPTGRLLAASVAEPGGRVRVWLFDRSGSLLRVLPPKGVTDLEFSPDARLLATATADGFTFLWEPSTGRHVRVLTDAKSGVAAIAFNPDGTLLATGGKDGVVRVWTVASGERTFFLFGHTNPVTRLAWSPDGRIVASGSTDKTVVLWRIRGPGAGSAAATLAGGRGPVRALAFTADGAGLVTAGDEKIVRVWNARPDQELRLLGRGPGPALAARWAGGLIVGLWPRVLKVYSVATRRVQHVFHAVAGETFTSVAASGDGSVAAAGNDKGGTDVWNERTGTRLGTFGGSSPVDAVAVSPRGDLVASGDRAGVVRVWSTGSRAIRWHESQSGAVTSIAFAPDGDRIVTSGVHGAVVWSSPTGEVLRELDSPKGDVDATFSPDGTLVATAGVDGIGRLWFARTGNAYRTLPGDTKSLTDVAFSSGGELLATSSADSDARVWGVAKGRGKVLQRSAFGPLSAVSLDPTCRWVAGAGPISVILWTAASGRQLFYLRGHVAPLTGASFSPDSPTVLSSSRDGTIRTYRCEVCVDLPALVHLAEVRLARTR